ncbi:MAG TPA: NlpC/P60 family protein [Candidatus Limnocylindrales bacterium]
MLGYASGLRAIGIAALVAASTFTATVAAPTVAAAGPSASRTTAATRVVRIAEQQRGKRYVFGATGPSAFDCSGLAVYAYRKAGVANHLRGRSGFAMLTWAKSHHRFSRSNPQLGDVVIYGNGAHVAIYIGNGRVISALNPQQGIRITGLHALHTNSVTGYIHTGLSSARAAVTRPAAKARPAAHTVRTRVYARLRVGASTSSRVVVTLRPGVRLHLVRSVAHSAKRWDLVVYGGHQYWVRADLVRAA